MVFRKIQHGSLKNHAHGLGALNYRNRHVALFFGYVTSQLNTGGSRPKLLLKFRPNVGQNYNALVGALFQISLSKICSVYRLDMQ